MSEVLDPAALAALQAMNRPGRPDLMMRVIDLFRADAPNLITTIQACSDSADLESVRMAAHSLKSSSAYVGAKALSSACAAIEQAARSGELEGVQDAIGSLDQLYADVVVALEGVSSKAA